MKTTSFIRELGWRPGAENRGLHSRPHWLFLLVYASCVSRYAERKFQDGHVG